MRVSFNILWRLPDGLLRRLFAFDCIRRPLVRVALRRVLRELWRRSKRHSGSAHVCFVDSCLSWTSYGLCSLLFIVDVVPFVGFTETPEFGWFLPEFGKRVSDFGGTYSTEAFWWDGQAGYGGRVDYLRWLCSCYGIDMDEYVKGLSNR